MDKHIIDILTGMAYVPLWCFIIYGLRDFPATMREIFAEERGDRAA